MRRCTIQEIQRRVSVINAEGFGLALVARAGAREVRELAEQMRRLRPDPLWRIRRRYRRRIARRSWRWRRLRSA